MNQKKILILVFTGFLFILIALALFLYNYNFPKKINVEREAVIFTLNDPSSQDSVYITTGDSYEQAIEVQDMMRNKFGEMFVPHK